MLLSVWIFLLPRCPRRRCQGIMPMVGTKGFSDPPAEPYLCLLWQTTTNPITAQLASPPRRYPLANFSTTTMVRWVLMGTSSGTYGYPWPSSALWSSSGHHWSLHQGHHGHPGCGHPGRRLLLTLTMAPHCFFLQLAQANQHQAPTTIFPNFLLNFLSHRPLLLQ